ncbi:tRNA (N6-isopentenyl adenosine(37)-C2)-methylthiotransferase MiaB [Curtanaerobium respiraculi]|uniref:tRNA (N6-isopentenyl adenosine(37)-C2)-methylthiotransferase MiaB n=1 Tax=Curtanaerobium respiraculi TaxID=2949669 RepID=UPI0024B3606B|nr:tRNA (N6-isopentenyl adenosine(37)-C2)-methylthiotransferase MiaB [Curtanaerobium respiraculi]
MFDNSTFFVTTFGCQMNKHDSERIAGLLESLGSVPVDSLDDADFAIYMTCCVRERADERLLGQVRSMKNLPVRPSSPYGKRFVAIGGCIGQRDGDGLFDALPNVDVVFGTHNMEDLPRLLQDAIESGSQRASIIDGRAEFHDELPEDREHPWAAWLPITVGCNNFCTYCIVPYVRGREISRPIEEIAQSAREYVVHGVKEITLLGQNVNSYGRDLYGRPRFDDVLDAVSASGVERIRFATSHPKDLTDGVIERFATLPNLMPALHLPVQSGSNRILTKMNRNYTVEQYLGLIEKLRRIRPGIALSTDIIVGFPGESEKDFQATYDLVERVGYSQVFTFIYSKRAGTPAAEMPDDAPHEVVQERFQRLVDLVQDSAYDVNQSDVGLTLPVLIEGESKRGRGLMSGKSPKNQTVLVDVPGDGAIGDYAGTIVDASITEARRWYLKGSIA